MQSLILPFILAVIASAQNVVQIPDGQVQAVGVIPQQVQPELAQPQQLQYAVPTSYEPAQIPGEIGIVDYPYSGDNVVAATGYGPEVDTYCPPTEYFGQAPASGFGSGLAGTAPIDFAGVPETAPTPAVCVDTDSGYAADTGCIVKGAVDVPVCVDLGGDGAGVAGQPLPIFEGAASKHSSGCLVVLMLAAGAVAMGMM